MMELIIMKVIETVMKSAKPVRPRMGMSPQQQMQKVTSLKSKTMKKPTQHVRKKKKVRKN